MPKNRPYIKSPSPSLGPREVSHISYQETIAWARAFEARHQKDIIRGIKIGSPPTDALGNIIFPKERFASAWASSLDSALGILYQRISMALATQRFQVTEYISGPIYTWQEAVITRLLNEYAAHKRTPSQPDYLLLQIPPTGTAPGDCLPKEETIKVDKYLRTTQPIRHIVVEEKAGGDLDKNKAQAVKRELLKAYAILFNKHPSESISVHLATAYDKDSLKKKWTQRNVNRVFHTDELLIAEQWWNTLVGSPLGYISVRAGLSAAAPFTDPMYYRLHALYQECQEEGVRLQYLAKTKPLYIQPGLEAPGLAAAEISDPVKALIRQLALLDKYR